MLVLLECRSERPPEPILLAPGYHIDGAIITRQHEEILNGPCHNRNISALSPNRSGLTPIFGPFATQTPCSLAYIKDFMYHTQTNVLRVSFSALFERTFSAIKQSRGMFGAKVKVAWGSFPGSEKNLVVSPP